MQKPPQGVQADEPPQLERQSNPMKNQFKKILAVSALCLSAHVASAATVVYPFTGNFSPTNPGSDISGANMTSAGLGTPTTTGGSNDLLRIPTSGTPAALTTGSYLQFAITTLEANIGFSDFSYLWRSNLETPASTFQTQLTASLDGFHHNAHPCICCEIGGLRTAPRQPHSRMI